MDKTRRISNFIYLHTHDSGRCIQPYGYPVDTPNFARLAKDSVLFRQCFSAAPTCSPSRAALLTGMAPHSCGMTGLAHRGFRLKDAKLHASYLLRENGFHTILSGIQHEAAHASELSYDRVISCDPREMDRFQELDPMEYDRRNARLVVDYLKTADKPFFLSFGMFSTHREFPAPADSEQSRYAGTPPGIRDTKESRLDMLAYGESVKIADECVKTVLDGIRDAGLEDSTLVLFTTDHGIAFPRMKCTLYDGGIGVACTMKYPGNPMKGKVVDQQISQLDLLPTIFELLELPAAPQFQGKSLVPLLEGNKKEARESVFAEVTYHAAYEPLRCVRTQKYKYIRRFDEEYRHPVPSNMDDCAGKEHLIRNGYLEKELPREELYDLDLDPQETDNLAGDPKFAADLEELKERLAEWMRETNDPLLQGPVPLPLGAFANRRACVSPSTPDFEFGN